MEVTRDSTTTNAMPEDRDALPDDDERRCETQEKRGGYALLGGATRRRTR